MILATDFGSPMNWIMLLAAVAAFAAAAFGGRVPWRRKDDTSLTRRQRALLQQIGQAHSVGVRRERLSVWQVMTARALRRRGLVLIGEHIVWITVSGKKALRDVADA